MVRKDHRMGVSELLGGCLPGLPPERTADSGAERMYRGTNPQVPAVGTEALTNNFKSERRICWWIVLSRSVLNEKSKEIV